MNSGHPSVTYGKSLGLLNHQNFNTFEIEWKDPMIKNSFGPTILTFQISKAGGIDNIEIEGIGVFRRVVR